MPEVSTFWLESMGRQVVDFFGRAPLARVRMDGGGWLGLTGEASADLNMGCIYEGAAASALLDSCVREAGDLPAVLMLENPTPELLEQAGRAGAEHVGQIPVMAWQEGLQGPVRTDLVLESGTGTLDVHPATTPREVDAAIALIAEAFSLDLEMCRKTLAPAADNANATVAGRGQRPLRRCRHDDGRGRHRRGLLHGQARTAATAGDRQGGAHRDDGPPSPERGWDRATGATRFLLGATEAGFHLYEQMGYRVAAEPTALVIGSSTQLH